MVCVIDPEVLGFQSHVSFSSKQARYLQIREGGNLIYFKFRNQYNNSAVNPVGCKQPYFFYKMPAWFLLVYFTMFGTSKGLLLNVTRVQIGNWQDLFSNLDPSAKCPNKQSSPDAGRTWCKERKGECSSEGCCICECDYPSATFQMNSTSCVGNRVVRLSAGNLSLMFISQFCYVTVFLCSCFFYIVLFHIDEPCFLERYGVLLA